MSLETDIDYKELADMRVVYIYKELSYFVQVNK